MINEQAKELNTYVLTKIAPSKIHGVGVFALQDIAMGDTLYADMMTKVFTLPYKDFDNVKPQVKQMILERWPQIVNGSAFMYPDTRVQAFMNHSDDANYDAINDVMLIDVKAGEEITEDYRKIPNYQKVHTWLQ